VNHREHLHPREIGEVDRGARSGKGRHPGRTLVVLASVCVLAVGVVAYWYLAKRPEAAQTVHSVARAAIPVSVAAATRQNIPIYLTGLGTVQASVSVDIRSQVDGKLEEVRFAEGQHVKKGDVLAKIDPRLFQAALDQARAKKAQDAALLAAAEKDLTRAKTLVLKEVGTQQNLDQQLAKVDQLKASLDSDDATIATAQTQLDYTTIVAPNDGRIGVRLVDPGNLVRASDTKPIANLVLTRPSAVLFTLPAQLLDNVREAMARGPVIATAFDQDNRRKLSSGKVLLIDNAVDLATATIRLKAIFANEDDQLWPGEFVNVRVLLETRKDAITIPTAAVQRGPQGLFTWVVSSNDSAVPRRIEIGPSTGDLTIVTSGVADGDRVVTDGQYKLRVNALVQAPKIAPEGTK
jgi:membrane fusion protein, multidrug efflux system